MEKFRIFDLKGDRDNGEREIRIFEIVVDISHFAGAMAGAAVVTGIKVIRYLNDLTIVDTILNQPADEEQSSDSKISKTNNEAD